jgi:hypothetical protein
LYDRPPVVLRSVSPMYTRMAEGLSLAILKSSASPAPNLTSASSSDLVSRWGYRLDLTVEPDTADTSSARAVADLATHLGRVTGPGFPPDREAGTAASAVPIVDARVLRSVALVLDDLRRARANDGAAEAAVAAILVDTAAPRDASVPELDRVARTRSAGRTVRVGMTRVVDTRADSRRADDLAAALPPWIAVAVAVAGPQDHRVRAVLTEGISRRGRCWTNRA